MKCMAKNVLHPAKGILSMVDVVGYGTDLTQFTAVCRI